MPSPPPTEVPEGAATTERRPQAPDPKSPLAPRPTCATASPGRRCDVHAAGAPDRRVIPVVRRLLADAETPVGVYRKLAKDQPGTFLLESAEHGGVWSRYSIVGAALPAPR